MSSPKPKSYHGSTYLVENVFRALRELSGTTEDRRQRILDACVNAHRPNRYDGTTDAMSTQTLEAWDACNPGSWNKKIQEMSNEEVEEITSNLICYLFGMAQDTGIAGAGQEPADYSGARHIDTLGDADELRECRKELLTEEG